jgi:hypothetical protein
MTPPRTLIPCPACGRTLGLPADAVGKPLNCPHCAAAFHVPRGTGGLPGPITAGVPPRRFATDLPRGLLIPAIALLMIGFAGVLVDGYLSFRFATQPNATRDYALGRAVEARSILGMGDAKETASERWGHATHAAAAGAALTLAAGNFIDDDADARLAAAWAPSVARASWLSLAASVLAAAGGACMLSGRFYWLALAGCVAATLNVNHLGCVPGGIAGVWGILTLVRDEGRLHFGITPPA